MEEIYENILDTKAKILKFEKKENNKNLLILHWWWWNSNSWLEFANIIVEKWYNVYVPDLPWFWETKLKNIYTLDNYAFFVEEIVKKLSLNDFILMWHSNWWAISIKLLNRWNLKIQKLVLNNSAWVRITKKMTFKRKAFKLLSNIFKPLKNIPWFQMLTILFYKILRNHDYINSLKVPFLTETYKNMIWEDLQDIMKNINVETLLLRWEKDHLTPLEYWKIINKNIKNSKMIVIEGEWHSIQLKNVWKLMKAFLDNV